MIFVSHNLCIIVKADGQKFWDYVKKGENN